MDPLGRTLARVIRRCYGARAMERLKAAIVGCGRMARWHGAAAARAGVDVRGVVDRDFERAQRFCKTVRGARAYRSLDELLDARAIDALHVCTPPESHEAIASTAIAAGVHVLAEKPLATTAAATERLATAARQQNVLLCPVHQYLFQRGYGRSRAWLGGAGQLRSIEMTICSAGAGGGSETRRDALLAEVLPHPLSIIHDLVGATISSAQWNATRVSPGELRVLGRAGETAIQISVSTSARPTESSLLLRLSGGTVHVDFFHGYAFFEPGDVSRMRKLLSPFDQSVRRGVSAGANLAGRLWHRDWAYPGLRPLVEAFYDAVRSHALPPVTTDAAIAIARARDELLDLVGIDRCGS